MARYSKYATTVIGAYSVPDWFEPLDRLLAVGQLSMASMAECAVSRRPGGRTGSGNRRRRCAHRRRDASAHAQPPFTAERDAEPFLAKNPAFQGSTRPKPNDHA